MSHSAIADTLALGDISPWRVLGISLDAVGRLVIAVGVRRTDISRCPRCGRQARHVRMHIRKWWHWVPALSACTTVVANVPANMCLIHGEVRAVVPWAFRGARYSLSSRTILDARHEDPWPPMRPEVRDAVS